MSDNKGKATAENRDTVENIEIFFHSFTLLSLINTLVLDTMNMW